jgi:hypothetical protein
MARPLRVRIRDVTALLALAASAVLLARRDGRPAREDRA